MIKFPDSGSLSRLSLLAGLSLILTLTACVRVKTEPIRIEPIYIEITINHRVQKELDNLFADIDAASETADYAPIENPDLPKEN